MSVSILGGPMSKIISIITIMIILSFACITFAWWEPYYPDKEYIYDPQKDITVYELSVIIPILITWGENYEPLAYEMIDKLPKEVKRHFKLNCDPDNCFGLIWSDDYKFSDRRR